MWRWGLDVWGLGFADSKERGLGFWVVGSSTIGSGGFLRSEIARCDATCALRSQYFYSGMVLVLSSLFVLPSLVGAVNIQRFLLDGVVGCYVCSLGRRRRGRGKKKRGRRRRRRRRGQKRRREGRRRRERRGRCRITSNVDHHYRAAAAKYSTKTQRHHTSTLPLRKETCQLDGIKAPYPPPTALISKNVLDRSVRTARHFHHLSFRLRGAAIPPFNPSHVFIYPLPYRNVNGVFGGGVVPSISRLPTPGKA